MWAEALFSKTKGTFSLDLSENEYEDFSLILS